MAEIRAGEVCLRVVGVLQGRIRKVDGAEVCAHARTSTDNDTLHLRLAQIRACEIDVCQFHPRELCVPQVGVGERNPAQCQTRIAASGADVLDLREVDTTEIGPREVGVQDHCLLERYASEVHTCEIGARQVRTLEDNRLCGDAGEVGAGEVRAREIGARQVRTHKVGTGKVNARHVHACEINTSEISVGA